MCVNVNKKFPRINFMDLLLDKTVVKKKLKSPVPVEVAIKNKSIIIFFFSAAWCTAPDCASILSILKDLYKESMKRNSGIEIIFVSFDTDEPAFNSYFALQGDWYAIPYKHPVADELRFLFGITTIPHIVVCKKTGEMISHSGNQELTTKGINVIVTWTD